VEAVIEPLPLRIDALLPQTQCGKCGFDGCLPYAQAIADGRADINRCPPGGAATIDDLAALLGCEPKPLDPRYGRELPPRVAMIDEESCIGCVKCLRVCPVDAIIGAPKLMHTVIPQQCTGCELCLPPCPVDCISLVPAAPPAGEEERRAAAARARTRFLARQKRLENQRRHAAATAARGRETDLAQKRSFIRDAVKRSQARRRQTDKNNRR
jgi:electron transport complex protein RnfB